MRVTLIKYQSPEDRLLQKNPIDRITIIDVRHIIFLDAPDAKNEPYGNVWIHHGSRFSRLQLRVTADGTFETGAGVIYNELVVGL